MEYLFCSQTMAFSMHQMRTLVMEHALVMEHGKSAMESTCV
jgi:hypothetical protein